MASRSPSSFSSSSPSSSSSGVAVFAPGRVNLIGEHVDYNAGVVVPFALSRGTTVRAAPLEVAEVHATSAAVDGAFRATLDEIRQSRASAWAGFGAYVAAAVLAAERETGPLPHGVALHLSSDLPLGAGLSSSASLLLGLRSALHALVDGGPIDARALARAAQAMEAEATGVRCGFLDPAAIALSREGFALRIDCRDESATELALPPSFAWLVFNSGRSRELAGSAYNARRAACERAVRAFSSVVDDERTSLRDIADRGEADALRTCSALDDEARKRAGYVLDELDRVARFEAALAHADLDEAGAILDATHRGLADDYEVSSDALDTLAQLARDHGAAGARMVGAGFGGCVLALVDDERAEAVLADTLAAYGTAHPASAGFRAWPSQGLRRLPANAG